MSTLLLAPICPHTCEHVWRGVLHRAGSVLTAGFPTASAPPDFALKAAAEYLVDEVPRLRLMPLWPLDPHTVAIIACSPRRAADAAKDTRALLPAYPPIGNTYPVISGAGGVAAQGHRED